MHKDNFVAELVDAFNLDNYFSDRVNTNFTVKGKKIVGLFAGDTDVAEYLHRVGKEIIEQQYDGREEEAGRYYNLNCFPFVLNSKEEKYSGNVKEVKLADSTNHKVIHNLKMHLVNEFRRDVVSKVIALLEKEVGIVKQIGHEWARHTVKIGAMDESNPLRKYYLYCIAFDSKYLEEQYDLEVFELFKGGYIQEFNSRLKDCRLKSSYFYDNKDDVLYIKNISGKVIKNVAEYVRERIALSFRIPGKQYSKIENFKDVLGSLIFKWTGKSIDAYECMGWGNGFFLIPLTETYDGQLESLKHRDRYIINTKYKNLIRDLKSEVEELGITDCQNPVYAFSNDGIVKLLPEIMQSPIAYNEELGYFEFKVDLENFRSRQSDSGYDGKRSPSSSIEGMEVDSPMQVSKKSNMLLKVKDKAEANKGRREKRTCDGRNLSNVSNASIDSAISSVSSSSQSSNTADYSTDSGKGGSLLEVCIGESSDEDEPSCDSLHRASLTSETSTKSRSSSVSTVIEISESPECFKPLSEMDSVKTEQQFSRGAVSRNSESFSASNYAGNIMQQRQEANNENELVY